MSLLETVDLKKYFGETRAVDNVNLTIEEARVRLARRPQRRRQDLADQRRSARCFRPNSGKIIFKGEDITHATVTERVKAGIARSFQLVNLFDDLTAFDNVALAIFSREGKTAQSGGARPPRPRRERTKPTPCSTNSASRANATSSRAISPRASASCSTWRSPTR